MHKLPNIKKVVSLTVSLFLLSGLLFQPVSFASGAFEMGLKTYREQNYEVAVRYFKEAVQADYQNANKHYYLADSLLKLRRFAEAQNEYQKILAMAPNSQAARLSKIGLARLEEFQQSQFKFVSFQSSISSGSREDKLIGMRVSGEDYLPVITDEGKYIRWSLLKMPIRIYVEKAPQGIAHFEAGYVPLVYKAMDVWAKSLGNQISYIPVDRMEEGDIRVTWHSLIDEKGLEKSESISYIAGDTRPAKEGDLLRYMQVRIGTLDITRKPQRSEVIYGVLIHELGHAIGLLGHSDTPGDIMYPTTNNRAPVTSPSERDLNTIRRLYSMDADVTNLPVSQRKSQPDRSDEIAKNIDAEIARQEREAEEHGMALHWQNLGSLYFRKGLNTTEPTAKKEWYQKALEATNKAVQLEPEKAMGYYNRSSIFHEMGQLDQALQDVNKAITLDKKMPDSYLKKAEILTDMGQASLAKNALKEYLLRMPWEEESNRVKRLQAKLAQG